MLTDQQLAQYEKDGYLVLEGFFDEELCSKLKAEVDTIVKNVIATRNIDELPVLPFSLSQNHELMKDSCERFKDSANGIELFMCHPRTCSIDELGSDNKLERVYGCANRIGHALHALNPVFKEASFSQPVKDVIKSIGFEEPIICQSSYIMRRFYTSTSGPGHQDASFIHIEPRDDNLVAICVAMQECSYNSGCFKVIPGSHKGGLKKDIVQRIEPDFAAQNATNLLQFEVPRENPNWSKFIEIPLKTGTEEKGSAVLINGMTIHKCACNSTCKPHEVYMMHIYDSKNTTFADNNLAKFNPQTFLRLF